MNSEPTSYSEKLIHFCQNNQLVVGILVMFTIFMGVMIAPFNWGMDGVNLSKVPVDAIPDIGENQQIVFTEWPGMSPRDIEDQVTYPLTASLLATPGVRTVRGYSMFGFSSIYVIFEEGVDFYWSRSRILEKLNSLPSGTLPEGVQPALGPDATALGQIFWYTIEGHDENGNPISDESIPSWFNFLSGGNSDSEAMRRWKEENTDLCHRLQIHVSCLSHSQTRP